MFLMIALGIFAGVFVKITLPDLGTLAYSLIRLALLPLIMGIGYEIIMIAGKHDNPLTRAISAPGLWVQRITTKEPTEDMLEVAITSLKCALRDDFPEFARFYEDRSWEPEQKAVEDNEVEISDDIPEKTGELVGAEDKTTTSPEPQIIDEAIENKANEATRVEFSEKTE